MKNHERSYIYIYCFSLSGQQFRSVFGINKPVEEIFTFLTSNLHDGWTPSLKRRNLFTSYSPFSTLSYFCKSNVVPICSEKIEVYNSSFGFWVLEVPIGVYLCYINPTAVPQVSKFMMKIFSNVKCVS